MEDNIEYETDYGTDVDNTDEDPNHRTHSSSRLIEFIATRRSANLVAHRKNLEKH